MMERIEILKGSVSGSSPAMILSGIDALQSAMNWDQAETPDSIARPSRGSQQQNERLIQLMTSGSNPS
jgi:hypothetical protein